MSTFNEIVFVVTLLLTTSCREKTNVVVAAIGYTDTIPVTETAVDTTPSYHDQYREVSITGHFTYMADAAFFESCDGKFKGPVSHDGEYLKTEKAYLNATENGGEKVFIEVIGQYLDQLDMEDKNQNHLVIDKLIELNPYRECE